MRFACTKSRSIERLGWAHFTNEKIAFKEFGNAEHYFQKGLAINSTNVYANAFLGNCLLQTGGDSAQALRHFQTALATRQERRFVRSLQLGGFHHDAPGLRVRPLDGYDIWRCSVAPSCDQCDRPLRWLRAGSRTVRMNASANAAATSQA